jgi:hypothetical protein
MDEERYIETLKREQASLAISSLLNPRARDAFEFGMLCGTVQAYERMLALLKEQQDEEDGKSRAQQSQRPSVRRNPYLEELDQAPTLPEQMGRR